MTLPEVEIHYGRFLAKTTWRPLANLPVAGRRIDAPRPVKLPEGNHRVLGERLQTLPVGVYPDRRGEREGGGRGMRIPIPDAEGRLSSADGRGELVKLATRLIIEEALEAESRDVLGRDYYEHGVAEGQGWRNGVRPGRLKTAEGMVDYAAPQITGREEPFHSEIRDTLKGRTQALEDLAVELLARGLSVRDIEDAFRDESAQPLLSRTAVSEIGERLWADYQEFASRDLTEHDIVYLFIDGIAERIRPGQKREPVLAAWGFTASGAKVLLHLMAGSKEDAETVSAFFQDMRRRGLGDPLLVVSDGAAGIIKAIETCFPRSARQRCLAHRLLHR